MRKLFLPLLLVGLFVSGADFPALPDGGSLMTPVDGGSYVGVATTNTSGWAAAMRCSPFGAYYCVSEGTCSRPSCDSCVLSTDGGADTCTHQACVPTQHNLYLAPDVTYDIEAPGGLNQFAVKTFDGGVPACNLFKRRDRGE